MLQLRKSVRTWFAISFLVAPAICLAQPHIAEAPIQRPEVESDGPQFHDFSRYDLILEDEHDDRWKDELEDSFADFQQRLWEIQRELERIAGGYNPSMPSIPSFTPPVHQGGGDCMSDFQICMVDASYDHAECVNDGAVAGGMAGQNGGAVSSYLLSRCAQKFSRQMSRCERNRSRCEDRKKFEDLVDEWVNPEDFINEILDLMNLMEQGRHDFGDFFGNVPGMGDFTVHMDQVVHSLDNAVSVMSQD